MKDVDFTKAYIIALAQFNLMKIKQENKLLKTTVGTTEPIPAYNFLPAYKTKNIGLPDCFESIKLPEDDDYKRGWLDGWIACTEYFYNKGGK